MRHWWWLSLWILVYGSFNDGSEDVIASMADRSSSTSFNAQFNIKFRAAMADRRVRDAIKGQILSFNGRHEMKSRVSKAYPFSEARDTSFNWILNIRSWVSDFSDRFDVNLWDRISSKESPLSQKLIFPLLMQWKIKMSIFK